MDAVLYDLINKKNYQIEKFTTSGTFTAKKTGVHFINGCGGGAGAGSSTSGSCYGGGAGAGCQFLPVFLTKGETVSITIGAGGAALAGAYGGDGGYTSFGSHISLPGGVAYIGGLNKSASSGHEVTVGSARHIGFFISGANAGIISSGLVKGQHSTFVGGEGASNSSYYLSGGGGGFFGPGGNANNAGFGLSAAANSGAGGGAGTTGGGNGGSGYLEVIYLS